MLTTDKKATELQCVKSNGAITSGACVGTKCMAWRWFDNYPVWNHTLRTESGTPDLPMHVPSGYDFVPYDQNDKTSRAKWVPSEEVINSRRGFCGLAGVPGAESKF